MKKYTQKFFYVSYKSSDNKNFKELFAGDNPTKAIENAKQNNPHKKGFKVNKTAYNTIGEKFED